MGSSSLQPFGDYVVDLFLVTTVVTAPRFPFVPFSPIPQAIFLINNRPSLYGSTGRECIDVHWPPTFDKAVYLRGLPSGGDISRYTSPAIVSLHRQGLRC